MIKILHRFLKFFKASVGSLIAFFWLKKERTESILKSSDVMVENFREWGFYSKKFGGHPRVLMASGHGYGNVGDEAQCGACIGRWRRVAPDCKITLFSPNPAYTEALHGERADWAPRVAWFRANTGGPYFASDMRFRVFFFVLQIRLSISCRFFRASIPFSLLHPREAHILQLIKEHDLVHISGGGFLTGKTRSRLWENCLLMRMCQLLNKPYILTGHNIGVFQNRADRRLTRKALRGAQIIGLRDRGISERALEEIGIRGGHVQSTCDDALLCERLDSEAVQDYLKKAGADSAKPWVAVQFHEWGQSESDKEKIRMRFAEICDWIISEVKLQVIFIAMTPSDIGPEEKLLKAMKEKGIMAPYSPDYRVVRGIIADSEFVFTMKHHPIVFAQGEGVPIVAVSLDDYYHLKNKGALEHSGHGSFLSHGKEFYTSITEEKIELAIRDRDMIRKEILKWVKEMQSIELKNYEAIVNCGVSATDKRGC